MTFWLFSGLFQKSGAVMTTSLFASFSRWPGASKIPPDGRRLVAEGLVFAL
jgi:hypothetical protein